MFTIADPFAQALAHHQAGRLDDAAAAYRAALVRDPAAAEPWHLLGVTRLQRGEPAGAVALIGRAVRLGGAQARYHNNLGTALRALGRFDAAIDAFTRAAERDPRDIGCRLNRCAT